jgi:hypothetical protein
MAAYRFSAQVIGRSSGRSATAAAAYRAAAEIMDERTGLLHDYTRKSGVLHSEILAPENTPAWMHDRAQLWNAVEAAEKRKDAQLCRELLLSLPHELTDADRLDLVRSFVRDELVQRGMVADVSLHRPHREGDDRNHHAHVLLTMRSLTGEGFGAKTRDWNDPALLQHWREQWANYQNRALERAGASERVDHRSLEAQGSDREPEPKQGPVATEMERNGKKSKAGDDRRAAKARNQERDEIKAEAEIIDLELARIERQEREEARQQQEAAWRKEQEGTAGRRAEAAGREEQRQAHERGRFEEWANARRAEAQSVRHEAEINLGRTHQAEKLNLENRIGEDRAKLDAKHRPDLAAIKQRQQRAKGSKGLARLLYRVLGRAAEDQAQAEAIGRTMRDFGRRSAERRQVLGNRQAEERANLDRAQEREAASVEQRIARARDRREREGWTARRGAQSRAAQREATTGRPIDVEAENWPVEAGPAFEGDTTSPEPSEAIHEAPTGQGEAVPDPAAETPSLTPEEQRQAELDARRAEMEARERDDRHPGRERER